jgi:hypothetical protein
MMVLGTVIASTSMAEDECTTTVYIPGIHI